MRPRNRLRPNTMLRKKKTKKTLKIVTANKWLPRRKAFFVHINKCWYKENKLATIFHLYIQYKDTVNQTNSFLR